MKIGQVNQEVDPRMTTGKLYLPVVIFCVFSILAQASLILVSWDKLPDEIPIFYSKPWGEAMLGSPIFIWSLPAIAILGTGLNLGLGVFGLSKNLFLGQILIVFSALVAFGTLYDVAKIISLLT